MFASIIRTLNGIRINTLCEIHELVPSLEDCLLFRLHRRVSIHRDGILGKLEEGHQPPDRTKCSPTERGIVRDISQMST